MIPAAPAIPAPQNILEGAITAPTPPTPPSPTPAPAIGTLRGSDSRCCSCGIIFATVPAFDQHWVGKLPHRRCCTPTELRHRFILNARGRWQTKTTPAEMARLAKLKTR